VLPLGLCLLQLLAQLLLALFRVLQGSSKLPAKVVCRSAQAGNVRITLSQVAHKMHHLGSQAFHVTCGHTAECAAWQHSINAASRVRPLCVLRRHGMSVQCLFPKRISRTLPQSGRRGVTQNEVLLLMCTVG
jgi:hypothetical protein